MHNTTLYEIVEDVDKIPLYNHLNMNGIVESSTDQQVKQNYDEQVEHLKPPISLNRKTKPMNE